MKKKLCVALLLVLMIGLLCGCGAVETKTRGLGPGRFVAIETYVATSPSARNDYCIIVDRNTKVQYLYHRQGVTPIFNPDGSLQIYQGELE